MTEFTQVFANFQNYMERYEGVDFRGNIYTLSGELYLIKWLPFGFAFETGDRIFYDPDDPFLGWSKPTYSISH